MPPITSSNPRPRVRHRVLVRSRLRLARLYIKPTYPFITQQTSRGTRLWAAALPLNGPQAGRASNPLPSAESINDPTCKSRFCMCSRRNHKSQTNPQGRRPTGDPVVSDPNPLHAVSPQSTTAAWNCSGGLLAYRASRQAVMRVPTDRASRQAVMRVRPQGEGSQTVESQRQKTPAMNNADGNRGTDGLAQEKTAVRVLTTAPHPEL